MTKKEKEKKITLEEIMNNNPNKQSNPNTPNDSTVQTKGTKPKTIHVAHRRSPSELTTLMCTYNLFLLSQPPFKITISQIY